RLFGRFSLRSADALRLDSTTDFTVQKLSSSGMLVEAGLSPALNSIVAVDMELGGKRLTGTARVAFVQDVGQAGGLGRARIGLEFVDLTPEGRETVNTFLSSGLQSTS
ncbi:MAG: hypothetical protein GXP48_06655, partial [Acidobacteria bacterium]|nr:hypothetical protein [Acidobacteriota bacterium]